LARLQNHPLVALVTVFAIVVIGLAAFTDALETLWKFAIGHSGAAPESPLASQTTPAAPTTANPLLVATPLSTPSALPLASFTPTPTPSEAELMISAVRAARPLQRRKIAEAYANIPVDWKLYFAGGDMAERAMTLHFDSSLDRDHNVSVMLTLLTKGHEDFALLEVGTPMRVHGRIDMVDSTFIALKDAEVERWSSK
jgi:hypothetical protein